MNNEAESFSEFISYICNVETLHLSSSTVKVIPFFSISFLSFFSLWLLITTLCFESKRRESWKLLSKMIENSPNLETLVLKVKNLISQLCYFYGRISIPSISIHAVSILFQRFRCICNCGVTIGGNVVKVVEIQGV